MISKRYYYLVLGLISFAVSAQEATDYALPHITRIIKRKNCVNCKVCFVEDQAGSAYVVKQYKNPGCSILPITTICELVAGDIGHKAGIPGDHTVLIPAGIMYEGKAERQVASLHEHAPGIRFDLCSASPLHKKISLCQKDKSGLTLSIIQAMSKHPDLPLLVALDTFVGNNDRNARNYFYDQDTDSFMGIDLGASFRRNLAKYSIITVDKLITEGMLLTTAELTGLACYYETLLELLIQNTPESMCSQLDEYAQKSGLFDDRLYDKSVQNRWQKFLRGCKGCIRQSYASTLLLCDALSELLSLHPSA